MTFGELFDALREDLEDFEDKLVHENNLSLDDDVDDPDNTTAEFMSFVVRKMQERIG